ncbi:MAG: Atxe2 family lasso peptide isopeptidase [Pseudomonadota bacterium]|nr:Atxe2 family lasso peptide isopeptidase [Pseudomonadota bacterium]
MFALLEPLSVGAQAKASSCSRELLPRLDFGAAASRALSARDLVTLRDFGSTDSGANADPAFSVSPDKRFAALVLRRAVLDTDTYCYGVLVIPLWGGRPRLVDIGGERIPATSDIRGVPAIDSGLPDSPPPIWSRDGRWLLFLRRDHGLTQVWRVSLDGRPARQLSHLATNALSLDMASAGNAVLVTIRQTLDAGVRNIDAEGRSGFLYDGRFWSLSEARPRPALPLREETIAIEIGSGAQRILSQAAALTPRPGPPGPVGATLFARSGGATAWTSRDDTTHPFAPTKLHVRSGIRDLTCPSEICGSRVAALWWVAEGRLLFLRGGGPENGGRTALYLWRIDDGAGPAKLFETIDALSSCQSVSGHLLCAKETAATPRRLVSVDIDSGAAKTIFDPNPAFAAFRLGNVQRLTWWDHDGNRSYGDLVLPPDHVAGQHHPLVVVQYTSQGFLRGGTGDEYPIYLLAQAGFAVLSFQRPIGIPGRADVNNLVGLQRLNIAGWRERRIIASVLNAGVDAAIAQGAVEQDRLGITGMSDGGTTTQFILLNSTRFKAAAVSSCCDDPSGLFAVGPAYRDFVISTGYPGPNDNDRAFWAPMSLARNAGRMRTPLLIQEPDMEYRLSLESVSRFSWPARRLKCWSSPTSDTLSFIPSTASLSFSGVWPGSRSGSGTNHRKTRRAQRR